MPKLSRVMSVVTAGLILIVFGGCSGSEQPSEVPSPTASVDCLDPAVPQDVWSEHCADEHEGEPSPEPSPYPASLDKTWQFVTEFNCKVIFQSVDRNADKLTKRVAQYLGKDDFFVLRASVDYRKPANNPDPDVSCGIANITLITEDGDSAEPINVGDLIEPKQDVDDTKTYNEGVDIYNTFLNGGAKVYRKGWDYVFFSPRPQPFSMVQVYPHGLQNSSIFAEQTDEAMPARKG